MRNARLTWIVIFALLLAVAALAQGATARAAGPALWIAPPSVAVNGGDSFTLRVMQHADAATTGAQVDLTFDRTMLQVTSVAPGAAYTGQTFFIGVAPQTVGEAIAEANGTTGRLRNVAAAVNVGSASIPAGDQEFLVITVTAVAGVNAASAVSLAAPQMLDGSYELLTGIALTGGVVGVGDADGDGISGPADNCPFAANPAQTNTDGNNAALGRGGADGLGDVCDDDIDGDGYTNAAEATMGKDPYAYCKIMRADLNNDGAVNSSDLTLLAQQFGRTVPPAPARIDQNSDNAINSSDLTLFAQVFTHAVSECP